jgi:glucose/arabinose dehydrogenase
MSFGTWLRVAAITAVSAVTAIAACSDARAEDEVRTGRAAYGDWHSDAPGVMRRITVDDLPKPHATPTTANPSRVVRKPADAQLKTMPGFEVAAFATGLTGARVVRVAPNGDVFVAQSQPGRIIILRAKDGAAAPDHTETFANGLDQPFGIAFYPPGPDPNWVYVAETHRVVRFAYRSGDFLPSSVAEVVVPALPTGGHWTRDIAFSPDGKTLYVSVGSASNVADSLPTMQDLAGWEKTHAVGAAWGREDGRATVLAFDADGKNRRTYATGLRNCSGLAVQPQTGTPYCATNERDLLGDDLPPDYLTSVKQDAFYGWPWYYIGAHEDPRHANKRPDLASKVTVPDVLLQPHSAPLGVAFNTGHQFPAAWSGDAFVAMHGSWNRALRTGYKIVRIPFKDGKPTGEYQDFVTGFAVNDESVWGRPVAVAFAHDGSLLFSDDEGGVVWRVAYKGK